MWEAALLSITPSYAQIKLQEGSRVGRLLNSFKESIDRPLAAILTLNTIAHTVGAVGVGNQATKVWAEADPLITGVAVPVGMTLAILVLSELIPKTLGANFWRELAPFTVRSLSLVITALYPLVWFSQFITRILKKDKTQSIFTRKDFLAMAEVGTNQGVFEKHESDIIASLLKFKSIRAMDVMTPRVVVKAVSRAKTISQFHEVTRDTGLSRIPLFEEESKDHITGYVLKDEVLAELAERRGGDPVSGLERSILSVAGDFPMTELFKQFLQQREHIAVVVDEFGGMNGIVTMEDVIETLLGLEIVDELDKVEDLQALARENWEKRAKSLGLLEHPEEDTSADNRRIEE
jgi:CBS domain containing-hemolysin-like protein